MGDPYSRWQYVLFSLIAFGVAVLQGYYLLFGIHQDTFRWFIAALLVFTGFWLL